MDEHGRHTPMNPPPEIAGDSTVSSGDRNDSRSEQPGSQFFRAILEDQTELICRYHPQRGLTYVNKAYARYFGKTPREILDANEFLKIPDQEMDWIRRRIERLTPEHPVVEFEHQVLMPDGTQRWHHWTHRAIFNPHGQVHEFQAVGRDITQRKKAEEEVARYRNHLEELVRARTYELERTNRLLEDEIIHRKKIEASLRKSEERFRTVADFTYDWETWRAPDGSYIYVSPSCERITGYSRTDFMASPWLTMKMVVPEDRDGLANHFLAERTQVGIMSLDFRIRTKNGETRWISHFCQPIHTADGTYLGRRGSNRDVTSRKRMEKRIRESAERYHLLVQGLPLGVMSTDHQQRITEWNAASASITGYRVSDALGRHCRDVLKCPGDQICPIQEAIRLGRPVGPFEKNLIHKSGNLVPVRIRAALLYNQEGQVIGGVETFQDIGDVKAMERERANLISMMVHDMKSPLVSIAGLTKRLMNKSTSLDEIRIRKYLEIIMEESGRLEKLVSGFLDVSRLNTGRMPLNLAPVDLKVLVEEVVHTLWPRLVAEGMRIEPILPESGLTIQADALQLNRVLTNLLDNAIKYSSAESTIRLIVEGDGPLVTITVKDQGLGIPPEDIPFIFEPFYRAHNHQGHQGHGLGLAGVAAIVKAHGGWVNVESRLGQGASFAVKVPVAGPDSN